ncbi:MAG: hypothetical protein PVJ41_03640, partial [Desulfobacterales bacterium]
MIDTAVYQNGNAISQYRQAFWAGAANRLMASIDRLYATVCNRSACPQSDPRLPKTVARALLWLLMICLLLMPAGLKAQDF